uniref:Uncharacterized protein n=1 Tax=Anguilla anguilla TaxID=7936 RepID=A0A0E9TXW0_ANGAN
MKMVPKHYLITGFTTFSSNDCNSTLPII